MSHFWTYSLLLISLLSGGAAFCQDTLEHDGYVTSVEEERRQHVARLEVPAAPVRAVSVKLKDKIFTGRLTREFKDRYREQFGQTHAEQSILHPSRYNYYGGSVFPSDGAQHVGSFQGDEIQRYEATKGFGNFMVKRLTEHHVDAYMKKRPAIRKVYALKEKISKVRLEIAKDVKLKMHYDFSGNFLRLRLDNPWLDNQVLVEMDQSRFGPTKPEEVVLSMKVPVTTKAGLEAYFRFLESSVTLIGRQSLGVGLSATLTGKLDARRDPGDPNSDRENLMLTGVSYNY